MQLNNSKERIEGCGKYEHDDGVLYVYSIAILKPFQGRGLAKVLKSYLLGKAKALDYRMVIGHSLEGASISLSLNFGARIVNSFDNWYGTNRMAYLYELLL